MTLEEKLWKTFNKALGQYQLIDEDDKILVGLSGGKDSLCLLEFLARRSKVHVPHFTVEALHVRMENIYYETDTTYLQSFCDRLGVPLRIVTTSFNADVSPLTSHPSPLKVKPACFLCSWYDACQTEDEEDAADHHPSALPVSGSRHPTVCRTAALRETTQAMSL